MGNEFINSCDVYLTYGSTYYYVLFWILKSFPMKFVPGICVCSFRDTPWSGIRAEVGAVILLKSFRFILTRVCFLDFFFPLAYTFYTKFWECYYVWTLAISFKYIYDSAFFRNLDGIFWALVFYKNRRGVLFLFDGEVKLVYEILGVYFRIFVRLRN